MTERELTAGITRLTAAAGMMLQKDDVIAEIVDTTDNAGWAEIPAPDYPEIEIPEEE